MTEQQKRDKWGPIICTMVSKSEPDKKPYEVRYQASKGTYSCNCKGFIFNKTCKHTAHAIRNKITDNSGLVCDDFREKETDDPVQKVVNILGRSMATGSLTMPNLRGLAEEIVTLVGVVKQPVNVCTGMIRHIVLDD